VLPITLPPHETSETTRHCHGHEFGVASVPPTMRVSETSGWIAGLPHCDDGGGGTAGSYVGSGGTVSGCGDVTINITQSLPQSVKEANTDMISVRFLHAAQLTAV